MKLVDRLRGGSAAVRTAVLAGGVMFVLGVVRVGRSFGYDEGYTYYFFINGGSVRRALTTQIVFNNHPMFSATQALAWRLGLVGETTQRLGPVICAVATVALVAWFVARRTGSIAGIGAGLVVAMNPVFLDQARQLRGYALAALGVTAAGVAVYESWTDRRRRWLIVQGVGMVIAVTTHAYSALSIVMIAATALVLGRVRREHVITWAISAVAALAIMSPVLDDMRTNAAGRGERYFPEFPVDLMKALAGWEWPVVIVAWLLALGGCLVVARRSVRHAVAIGAASAVFASAVVTLWQIVQPFDLYFRFFMSVIPFVAILVGIGIGELPRVAQGIATVVIAVLLAPGVGDILSVRPTVREAATAVTRARDAGLEVCGRHVEPLWVYTAPFRLVSGIDDFEDCEVYVSVLRMSAEQRDAARSRFGEHVNLGGGISIWTDVAVLDSLLDES